MGREIHADPLGRYAGALGAALIARDGKKVKYQQLFSCQIMFGKVPKNNIHVDVSGKTFKIGPDYNVRLK